MVQREPRCPRLESGEIDLLAHSPVPSRCKRRPRGALLQPVVVLRVGMCRVGGSRRSPDASSDGGNDETPLFLIRNTHPLVGNIGRWAVWVGRHALKKITRAPNGQLR